MMIDIKISSIKIGLIFFMSYTFQEEYV